MTKEEMKLKVHYELRNNIGAMALDKEGSVIGIYFRNLYKRIRKDQTIRYLETDEKKLNAKAQAQGYLRYVCAYGWMMKGETNGNF